MVFLLGARRTRDSGCLYRAVPRHSPSGQVRKDHSLRNLPACLRPNGWRLARYLDQPGHRCSQHAGGQEARRRNLSGGEKSRRFADPLDILRRHSRFVSLAWRDLPRRRKDVEPSCGIFRSSNEVRRRIERKSMITMRSLILVFALALAATAQDKFPALLADRPA